MKFWIKPFIYIPVGPSDFYYSVLVLNEQTNSKLIPISANTKGNHLFVIYFIWKAEEQPFSVFQKNSDQYSCFYKSCAWVCSELML